jgi:hypothetical protein
LLRQLRLVFSQLQLNVLYHYQPLPHPRINRQHHRRLLLHIVISVLLLRPFI